MKREIIDAHVHLITPGMIHDMRARAASLFPTRGDAIVENFTRRFEGKTPEQMFGNGLATQAADWLKAMDSSGVDRAVFFPISERFEDMRDFVAIAPDRFVGYAFINDPTSGTAAERLREAVKVHGFRGLKVYPPIQMFNPCDKALFPLYEEACSLRVPITFHFGITLGAFADYRYADPMDLQLPLKLFPELNFIIAHFGAGYFREACLLAFHNQNVFLDTSGTNNWRDYTPERTPLFDVFKRAVEIYSPERIIFGTDTVIRAGVGYRAGIKAEQEAVVDGLPISGSEKDLIMGGNARRLYLGG